ncbi:MAG: glutaredoxin domain-containing protein [bacterium]
MGNIEIYTGPNCSYCEQAKALLQRYGLGYSECDISTPEVMEEFRQRLPRSKALPQIFIDGEHIGSLEDLQSRLTG